MKRSEINALIGSAKEFFRESHFLLPPWAEWEPGEWKGKKKEVQEIVNNMLGWDLTDFGSGNFFKQGLLLFTLRNGRLKKDRKPYAEKIMIVEEMQETPMHFHWKKMEDIINRGGGNLQMELFNADKDEKLTFTDVSISIDGIRNTVPAGTTITLEPGQSVCLEPGVYHRFWGKQGKGKVLVGEVSSVNDDKKDNRFLDGKGRFPTIEEDEPPMHLLVSDYSNYL
ncbi:MAG TPA: D-lyxose/D-mannose family sugar isomerase [Bacteroidales bacterium]|nr:D-lyxose/D-mannose family sugar isomerase [Bacteroidales bacterium]